MIKRVLSYLKEWCSKTSNAYQLRRMQDLREEATRNIVIRPIRHRNAQNVVSDVFGILVCGELIYISETADEDLLKLMLKLREMYIEMWKSESSYQLL